MTFEIQYDIEADTWKIDTSDGWCIALSGDDFRTLLYAMADVEGVGVVSLD